MKNTEKMTNRKALTYVMENFALPTDVEEKLSAMLTALDKKSSGTRKPTANQIANEGLKEAILKVMKPNHLYRVKELAKLAGMESFSKCSSLVKQLKDGGAINRTEDKGIAYFSLATSEED